MSHGDLSPSITDVDFALLVRADVARLFNFALESRATSLVGSDVVLNHFLWHEAATTNNELHFAGDQLMLIDDDLLVVRDEIIKLNADLQTRLFEEFTTTFEYFNDVFTPNIVSAFSGMFTPLEEVLAVLANFIHPDLARANDVSAIGLGQINQSLEVLGGILLAGVGGGQTELIEALTRVADALEGQTNPDLTEWLARFSKGQATERIPNVQTIDVISPFLSDEGSVWTFAVNKLAQVFGDIAGLAFKGADFVAPVFLPMITPVIQALQEKVERIGVVTPDQAFPLAQDLLQTAFTNGLKAHLVSVLCEKGGDQIKNLGIQQIAGLVGELGGFSEIASAVWGNAVGASVGRAGEYQVNAITRSRIPSEGQLIEGTVERKMGLDEQAQLLAFHGYNDRYIRFLQEAQWTDPRLREIVLLASDVSVQEDDVRHWLEEAGYDDRDVARMAPVVIQQSLKGERGTLKQEIMANLREGFIDEEDAEAQFQRMRFTPEATQLMLDAGRLAFRRELIAAHQATLETMFANSQIAEAELRLGLLALGIRGAKVDAVVGKAVSKFSGRVAREEDRQIEADVRELQRTSLAALKEQFALELIGADAFRINLEAIGFLPAVAREIVTLEQLKLLARVEHEKRVGAERLTEEIRRARVAAFIELFREGLIGAQELNDTIVQLGVDPALAQSIVFREQSRKAELPKVVS